MTAKQTLEKEFELISEELTKRYDALGMRASGRWERGKKVDIKEEKDRLRAIISGEKYTEQLEYGRGPSGGKGGSGPSLRDKIFKWILDKGIMSDIPTKSLAFLIARKIHAKGWKREGYGGVELVSSVITPERIPKVIDKVGAVYADVIVRGLVKELEKFAVAA